MSTLTSSSSVAPWGAGVGWWGGGSCHTIYIYNIIYMARACVASEMCECVSTARVRGGGGWGGRGGYRGLPRFSLPSPSFPSLPFSPVLSGLLSGGDVPLDHLGHGLDRGGDGLLALVVVARRLLPGGRRRRRRAVLPLPVRPPVEEREQDEQAHHL